MWTRELTRDDLEAIFTNGTDPQTLREVDDELQIRDNAVLWGPCRRGSVLFDPYLLRR